jgi:hypothetical protein
MVGSLGMVCVPRERTAEHAAPRCSAGFFRGQSEEKVMQKSGLWVLSVAAGLAALAMTGGPSHAAIVAPSGLSEAAVELRLAETQTVQFRWGGHRYCWYSHGWRGPGWYRCGFRSRRGLGWGGPAGWHGWRHPGFRPPHHRPVPPIGRPPRPGRPGNHRPLPATR